METQIYPVPEATKERALIDKARYEEMYAKSVEDNEAFWAGQAQRIDWIKPFTKVKNVNFNPGQISIKWFEDGELNVAANCLDRHVAAGKGDIAGLFARAFPDIEVHPRKDRPVGRLRAGDIDLQTPFTELARYLRPDLSPAAAPVALPVAGSSGTPSSGANLRARMRAPSRT